MKKLALALLVACGSAVTQGAPYQPPNELPIGEPTDRSDAGGASDAASDGRGDSAFLDADG